MSCMQAKQTFSPAREAIRTAEARFSIIDDRIPKDLIATLCKDNPDHELVVYREQLVEKGAKALAAYKSILNDVITCEKALLLVHAMPKA